MSDQTIQQITSLAKKYADEKFKTADFIPGKTVIPPSGKKIDGTEVSLMIEAALDGWLTTGRFNDIFEKKIAEYIGVRKALTTTSGSSANLLALTTLTSPTLGNRKICKGDEVITVAAGFPTTVNPAIQNGLVPVFVDIHIPTYNIDVTRLEQALSSKTKAVMIAHTLGNPFDLKQVKDFCTKNNLWLIEDCCDALGSQYENNHVGTYGDLATCSFYPAHHITMGEGGLIFSNNTELLRITESFRDWGRDCYCKPGADNTCGRRYCWKLGDLPEGYDHKYIYTHVGYNLKITDMQAACGLAQLAKLKEFVAARRNNFDYLKKSLEVCSDVLLLPEATPNSNPSWFGFPITIKDNADFSRKDLLDYLNERMIGTRLLFAGNLTKQPYMKNQTYRVCGTLDNSDKIMKDTFWIGVQPALTKEMLDYSIESIKNYCGHGF